MQPRRSSFLKNIGPVSAAWLADVGIRKRADLIRLGAVPAYVRVKQKHPRATLNLLWALAGAERGLKWSRLTVEDREALLLELDAAQGHVRRPRKKAAPRPSDSPLI